MFLSDRLILEERLAGFLFWGVLAFPAPETFDLDLDTPTGLAGWLGLSVSGLTTKPDRSGECSKFDVLPVREARMVTWKSKGNTIYFDIKIIFKEGLQLMQNWCEDRVRPSSLEEGPPEL